jgi:hypothetical protein
MWRSEMQRKTAPWPSAKTLLLHFRRLRLKCAIEGARSRSHGPAAERPALGLGESEWEWNLITAARHWRSEMQRKTAPCTASAEHSSASTAGSDARYLGKRLDPASGLHAAVA